AKSCAYHLCVPQPGCSLHGRSGWRRQSTVAGSCRQAGVGAADAIHDSEESTAGIIGLKRAANDGLSPISFATTDVLIQYNRRLCASEGSRTTNQWRCGRL